MRYRKKSKSKTKERGILIPKREIRGTDSTTLVLHTMAVPSIRRQMRTRA